VFKIIMALPKWVRLSAVAFTFLSVRVILQGKIVSRTKSKELQQSLNP